MTRSACPCVSTAVSHRTVPRFVSSNTRETGRRERGTAAHTRLSCVAPLQVDQSAETLARVAPTPPTLSEAPGSAPARAPASDVLLQALQALCPELVGALPRGFQLRTAQAHHMHALAGGGDFLGVAATAAGKSLCLFVASAAEALARRRREGEAPRQLTPVQLIVVPFANLGPSLQDWGNQFYHQVAASHFPGWECERYFPRVLYAERTYGAPGASDDATPAGMTPRASGTCPKGHMLCFFADSHSARGVARHAWCNVCGRDLKRGDRRGNCAACDWDVCMLWPVRPRRGATTGGGGVGV